MREAQELQKFRVGGGVRKATGTEGAWRPAFALLC